MIGKEIESRCLADAVAWQVHLADRDLETSPEFEAWLTADPEYRRAWDCIQRPWQFVGQHATSPEVLALRRMALADAQGIARERWAVTENNSLQKPPDPPPAGQTTSEDSRPACAARIGGHHRRRATAWIAFGTAALLAFVGFFAWFIDSPDVYRTRAGERRVVTLADGSQVQLDSSTELRVNYTAHARDLTLLRGQARFDVSHDIERPFVVTAGGRKVVATGTAFNVDLLGTSIFVTLIEGRVVVLEQTSTHLSRTIMEFARSQSEPNASAAIVQPGQVRPVAGVTTAPASRRVSPLQTDPGVELSAGQELIVSPGGEASVIEANVNRTTSWQTGQLTIDNELLTSVVERMNRYSSRPIEIGDERTGNLRISGVFHVNDVPGFIDALTRYLPIQAELSEDAIRISHR